MLFANLLVDLALLTRPGRPELVAWGYMIGVARTVLRVAWWMAAIPSLTIILTVLAINLVVEGLNEAAQPPLDRR